MSCSSGNHERTFFSEGAHAMRYTSGLGILKHRISRRRVHFPRQYQHLTMDNTHPADSEHLAAASALASNNINGISPTEDSTKLSAAKSKAGNAATRPPHTTLIAAITCLALIIGVTVGVRNSGTIAAAAAAAISCAVQRQKEAFSSSQVCPCTKKGD